MKPSIPRKWESSKLKAAGFPRSLSPRRRGTAGMTLLFMITTLTLSMAGVAKKTLHIVALGDSTTAGTPFFRSPLEEPPEGRGDPEGQYGYWMMKQHPTWEVLNRGVNGQRTDEIKARFDRDALKENPRYVILLAGVNDIYQNYPLTEIKRDLLWMYQKAKAGGVIPIAATVLPFDKATEVQARKIRLLNRWIRRTATSQGIPFCDLNAVVRDPAQPNRLKTSPDGLHPDIRSYKDMGEVLAQLIEGLESKGGVMLKFQLTSPAFVQGSAIPKRFTCEGDNISPELDWTDPRPGTKSFALIVEDPDAPRGTFIHWVTCNIPATERKISERFPSDEALPNGTRQGVNGFGKIGYEGPCPPFGTHRYFFKLYALDAALTPPAGAGARELRAAMKGHLIEETDLMGTATCKPAKTEALPKDLKP
jgi:Raf kinase inhibitor-like YbhB/YbcL family protein